MRFRLISVAAALLLFAAPLLLAAPARAGNGPGTGQGPGPGGSVGCTAASSCEIELENMVTFNGNQVPGTNNTVVDITPPPCLWEPVGDAHTGSQHILNFDDNADPGPGAPFDTGAAFKQAQQLLKSNPITPGEWYELPLNPDAPAAVGAECLRLPLWYFLPPGQALPGLNIPPQTLAQLAFARLVTASLGTVTFNPRETSDTNLPTFIDVRLGNPPAGALHFTAAGLPYVAVTAAIPGQDSATVWAEAGALTIDPGTSAADTFDAPVCSTVHGGAGGYSLGSQYSPAQMAAVGVNQSIDCGVTYTTPGSYGMTASIDWTACWADTGAAVAPPGPPPAGCQPVPGAGDLQPSAVGPVAVNVREIQSVNG
jgi:hypothetical protein